MFRSPEVSRILERCPWCLGGSEAVAPPPGLKEEFEQPRVSVALWRS